MRTVWNGDEWWLLVYKVPVEDAPEDHTVRIDLGISNYLTIDYDGPSELYPGNVLKENKRYFTRKNSRLSGTTARQNGH